MLQERAEIRRMGATLDAGPCVTPRSLSLGASLVENTSVEKAAWQISGQRSVVIRLSPQRGANRPKRRQCCGARGATPAEDRQHRR